MKNSSVDEWRQALIGFADELVWSIDCCRSAYFRFLLFVDTTDLCRRFVCVLLLRLFWSDPPLCRIRRVLIVWLRVCVCANTKDTLGSAESRVSVNSHLQATVIYILFDFPFYLMHIIRCHCLMLRHSEWKEKPTLKRVCLCVFLIFCALEMYARSHSDTIRQQINGKMLLHIYIFVSFCFVYHGINTP